MRGAARLWAVVFAILALALAAQAATQYVQVKKPLVNVYEYLDPQSQIIVQAKRGDHFELVYPGTSWYQVKVKDKVGWLERRAGEVVNTTSSTPVALIAVVLILLVGTVATIFIFVQKQKTVELDI